MNLSPSARFAASPTEISCQLDNLLLFFHDSAVARGNRTPSTWGISDELSRNTVAVTMGRLSSLTTTKHKSNRSNQKHENYW